jgi:hypothetical protein
LPAVPVAGSTFWCAAPDAAPKTYWKSAHGNAYGQGMGFQDHRDALKAAAQRVASIKVSL